MENQQIKNNIGWILLILFIIGLAGCATPKRNALPARYADKAEVVGIPGVRDWGYEDSNLYQQDLVKSIKQHLQYNPKLLTDKKETVNILALSGGGANGAFGVGLINGWTASGSRPQFILVTGISTGALIAPFAFLGPKYDAKLHQIYTTMTTKDVIKKRSIFSILTGSDSLTDSAPLANLIAKNVNANTLAAIAKAYAHGRRLYIGTTNLDARKLVIWNMGAIAASGKPGALKPFRQILLASASIPVAMPPVLIPVEAGGKTYDEMHVDGGVTTEVFLHVFMVDVDKAFKTLGVRRKLNAKLFIIRNNQIEPPYDPVKRRLLAITDRALSDLITAQGIGDLYRIYLTTQKDQIGFNLAYIPADFVPNSKEAFDPEEMKRLYNLGYKMAKSGYPWDKHPPGFSENE